MAKKAVAVKRRRLNFFNPRQEAFLANFYDPKSKTFGNISQSALAAGFSKKYAENVVNKAPEWLVAKVEERGNNTMLEKAERNLEEMLELKTRIPAMGAFGPIYEKIKNKKGKVIKKVPVLVESIGLLKVKADVSEFVAERIGRSKYGKDPEDSKGPSVVNFTQININRPNAGEKDAGDKSDGKAVPRMVGTE